MLSVAQHVLAGHPNAQEGECTRDAAIGCMPRPALIVMTHMRPDMTARCLEQLKSMRLRERFTVYVSQDTNDPKVHAAAEAAGFVSEVLVHSPRPARTTFDRSGLAKIAEHFRSALEAVLTDRGHSHVVVVEDDLLLSPDFLLLFWSSAWLLDHDPSLWCVSAWNDQVAPRPKRARPWPPTLAQSNTALNWQ